MMFLTGATVCLLGWSLLPQAARDEFRWLTWLIAGFPPGLLVLVLLMGCIMLLFRPTEEKDAASVQAQAATQIEISTDGQTFSHTQARKLMLCKCAATFIAIAASVPYWRWLGLIQ